MNKVYLIGRLVSDPDVRYSQGDTSTAIAKYRLAVNRRFKRDADQEADFISCVSFGKNGEFAEKYLKKGMKIAVSGRIQTGNYTNQEGQKVYTTDIVVEEHEFCESKGSEGRTSQPSPSFPTDSDGFINIPDGIDEELPFN